MQKLNLPKGLTFLETKVKTRLLEEAFKLYGVRETLGNKNNPEIISWAKDCGLASYNSDEIPWCFKGDMEILTSKGFLTFKDLIDNHYYADDFPFIAQVNEEGRISYTSEWLPIIKPFYGELFRIKRGNAVNIVCDSEHQFYGKWSGNPRYEKRAIKDITKYGLDIPIVKGSNLDHPYISDNELKLLAAFLSDGTLYNGESSGKFKIKVSKYHKIAELDNYPYERKTKSSMGFRKDGIIRKQTYEYLFRFPESFEYIFDAYKLLKQSFILALGQRQAKLFIDTYKLFDGTQKPTERSFTVFTGVKEQADNLVLLASLAGYKNSLYATPMVSKNTKIPFLYNIHISEGKVQHIGQDHITTEFFEGELYCVTVPSGLIVIRDYSKNIFMTGNCGLFMAYIAKHAGKPEVENPLWALNWAAWGKPSLVPRYGDVLVFKRKTADGKTAGHIGLYLAESKSFFYVLGGNTNDKVGIAKIAKSRLVAARNSYKVFPACVGQVFVKDEEVNLNISKNEA